jgi:long-chain acyl-CoA synthetase
MSHERSWHRSYPAEVSPVLDVQPVTMPRVLADRAAQCPNSAALDYMGKILTYREFDSLVNRFGTAIFSLGIRKGDKVAILLPNLPQTAVANLAAMRIGAVPVMLNPLYTDRELTYQLNDSEAKLAVTLDLLLPKISGLREKTGVGKIVCCHLSDYLPFPKKQLFPVVKKEMYRKIPPGPQIYEFTELIRRFPAHPLENTAGWEDTAVLIYTGGTTGVSKGVVLSHANLSSNVQQLAAHIYDVPDGEGLLFIFPFFHSAGHLCMHLSIWMGLRDVLIPKPDPALLADAIARSRPNYIGAVPTTYVGLLALEKFRKMDLSFIKGFFSGAAPLPEEIIRQLKEATGSVMLEIYGMTETSPVVTATPWRGQIKVGTVGIPVPSTDMKIMDTETGDTEMPPGEAGEICFRGPQVMTGYYRKPEETEAIIRDGWIYTGDIGVVDEDGYLMIVDRKKDVIIAGGFNVYPKEIDEVLFTHPKILEACTIGVPDAYRGETVKSFIVVRPGESLTAAEIFEFCREKLSAYKVPKRIEFMDDLPKSAVGKILRRELREMEKRRQSESSPAA